jgi:hypothetical protein
MMTVFPGERDVAHPAMTLASSRFGIEAVVLETLGAEEVVEFNFLGTLTLGAATPQQVDEMSL